MICDDTILALSGPLPQWMNFLAMAGAILLVAVGAFIWFSFFRKSKKPRKRKRRRHHREQRGLNPTLAQSGGLPPVRKEEEDSDAP